MNYDAARPLADGKGWHWTTMNDGKVRTAWPCVRYIGPEPEISPAKRGPEDFYYCEPHDTQEEAELHFYEQCLASATVGSCSWTACEFRNCDNPTQYTLGNRLLSRWFQDTPLCDKHRDPETLKILHPFHLGLQVIHS